MKDHQNAAPEVEVDSASDDGGTGTTATGYPEVMSASAPDSALPSMGELQASLQRLEAEVASLHRALATREFIGLAIGLIAAWQKIGTNEAWQVLRTVSSLTNVPTREISRLLVASANGPVTGPDAEALRLVAETLLPARERAARRDPDQPGRRPAPASGS